MGGKICGSQWTFQRAMVLSWLYWWSAPPAWAYVLWPSPAIPSCSWLLTAGWPAAGDRRPVAGLIRPADPGSACLRRGPRLHRSSRLYPAAGITAPRSPGGRPVGPGGHPCSMLIPHVAWRNNKANSVPKTATPIAHTHPAAPQSRHWALQHVTTGYKVYTDISSSTPPGISIYSSAASARL